MNFIVSSKNSPKEEIKFREKYKFKVSVYLMIIIRKSLAKYNTKYNTSYIITIEIELNKHDKKNILKNKSYKFNSYNYYLDNDLEKAFI